MFHIHLSSLVCRPLLLAGVGLLVAACGIDDSGAEGLLDPGTGDSAAPTTRVRDAAPREDAGQGRNNSHDGGQVEESSAAPEGNPPDATSLTRPEAATDFDSATSGGRGDGAADGAWRGSDGGDADRAVVDSGHDADDGGNTVVNGNPCAALTFPSGVIIQTFQNAAMTASYANHLVEGQSAPTCFLDVNNLINPVTSEVYDTSVQVATHFQLVELVGEEVSGGYGNIVLVLPTAVTALEAFRDALDAPVTVDDGFRTPQEQEDICQAYCGDPLGCGTSCPNGSRHMFGDAFDLPMSFDTTSNESDACTAGFKYVTLETVDGDSYLHMDQDPAVATCTIN